MQVYKTFFLMLKKQKGMILMYLGIFVAVAWLVAGQGQKNEEKQFQKESYTFAVLDHDDTEISRGLTAYMGKEHKQVEIRDDEELIQDENICQKCKCCHPYPERVWRGSKGGKRTQACTSQCAGNRIWPGVSVSWYRI